VYPKTHPETDAAGNKGTGFEKRLIPVEWRDGRFSWRLDHPQAIRWSSGTVMRLRAEPDPKDEGGSIMQVETAQVNAQGTEAEVAYFRGRGSEQSVLTLHMPSLAPRDNTWIAVRFEPREPAEDELVVIAVLSGKFVSSLAPSVSLSVGEAACLQVSRSRQVKIIQQAKLEQRDKGWRLSWSPVEDGYNPAEVWVYQTDKVEDRVERLIEIVQGGYPLNPYVMWATQSAIADF
ncbi:MAG: hypothetical protein N2554_03470, partial [Fimbriimonadales bacterium]|nr:hypothetical protein [Fimbriimonadales bacterium]